MNYVKVSFVYADSILVRRSSTFIFEGIQNGLENDKF